MYIYMYIYVPRAQHHCSLYEYTITQIGMIWLCKTDPCLSKTPWSSELAKKRPLGGVVQPPNRWIWATEALEADGCMSNMSNLLEMQLKKIPGTGSSLRLKIRRSTCNLDSFLCMILASLSCGWPVIFVWEFSLLKGKDLKILTVNTPWKPWFSIRCFISGAHKGDISS